MSLSGGFATISGTSPGLARSPRLPPAAGACDRGKPTDRLLVVGLLYLAAADLVVGVWATVDPAGWYRNFPGFARHWAAAEPPYNHHLVTDAGAGFLGIGVVLVLAVAWRERHLVQAALLGSLAHDLPHFLYHLLHPARTLSTTDKMMSTGGLGVGCLVAVALLVLVTRQPPAGIVRA